MAKTDNPVLRELKKQFSDADDVKMDRDGGFLLIYHDMVNAENRDMMIEFVRALADDIKIEFDFQLYGMGMNAFNGNLVVKFKQTDVVTEAMKEGVPYAEPS